MSLIEELKRRNVVRMAVLYAVASWLILQIADVLFDQLGVPDWAFRFTLGLLILGFPLALIFSWVFEITPEGIKREKQIDRSQSITHETGRKINIAIVVLLLLAIAGLVADRLIPEHAPAAAATAALAEPGQTAVEDSGGAPAANSLSIAVLPFVNMSGDPDNEYFSDGLSEELLNTLVQIRDLKVTGRTSSFAFKGQNLDLREIGERLNVANVLEGSVRKSENRVRITAQLVKTDDGYHLWSETFDRELDDIFAIQQEIAEEVARALSLTLLGEGAYAQGHTVNTDAYQAYLRGLHIFRRAPDDREALETARGYFEQALALDPDYAAPLYGVYQYWNRIFRNGMVSLDSSMAGMREAVEQLQQRAPDSPEALFATAHHQQRENNWAEALALSRELVEQDPGSPESNLYLGHLLYITGQREAGIELSRRAVALDPLSLDALIQLIAQESSFGRCDVVRSLRERVIEIEPGYYRVDGLLGMCLLIVNADSVEALGLLEKEELEWMKMTGKAIAFNRLGRQEQAQQTLAFMMDAYGDTAAYQYAQIFAQWGDSPGSLDWLKTAMEVGDPGSQAIVIDPFLDPVRQEPGFAELLQQSGLVDCCGSPP